MKCPKEDCGFEMEEWGMGSRPVYECPIHGRIRVKRKPLKGVGNPALNFEER